MSGGGSHLYERELELSALSAAVDRATAGEGTSLLIEGPAGAGKTSVLDRFAATTQECSMLRVTCDEQESVFSLEVLRRLLLDDVAALPPTGNASTPPGPAQRALLALSDPGRAHSGDDAGEGFDHGLYWLVAELSAVRSPLVMIVDDAQWADDASLRSLTYLSRRVGSLSAVLVIARRVDPAFPAAAREDLSAAVDERHELAPLSTRAIERVLEDVGGAPVPRLTAAECERLSGGNPLLIRELARRGATPATAPEEGADLVGSRISARLRELGGDERRVIQIAAVLGTSFDPTRAGALLEMPPEAVAQAAERLSASGWLSDPTTGHFAHPLYRDCVLREIPQSRRAVHHLRAAELLSAEGAEDKAVIAQLVPAVPTANPVAANMLYRAGIHALRHGAPQTARDLLDRALEEPPPRAVRAEILERRALTNLALGDVDPALDDLREALAEPQPLAERAARLRHLEVAGRLSGKLTEALRLLDEQLAAFEWEPAERRLVQLTRTVLVLNGRNPSALSADEIAQLGATEGNSATDLRGLALLSRMGLVLGEGPEWTRSLARRALQDEHLSADEQISSTRVIALAGLIAAGAIREALERSDADVARARESGSVSAASDAMVVRAVARAFSGDLLGAEEDAQAAMAGAGDSPLYCAYAAWTFAMTLPLQDRGGELRALTAPLEDQPTPSLAGVRRLYARLIDAFARRHDAEALAAADELARIERDVPTLLHPQITWRVDAALAAHRLGDVERARALLDAQEQLEARWPSGWSTGRRLRGLGIVLGGDVEHFAESARALEQFGALAECAASLVAQGAALRAGRFRRDAVGPLERARELSIACNATAVTRRARDELEVLHARPEPQRFSGLSALTAAERRVARLAAQGHHNREIAQMLFVTERTIENQLARVFVKLGVDSRSALPSVLTDGASAPGAALVV